VSCFLEGIKFGIPNSRSHLARVLYYLDTPNEQYVDHRVWRSWIPPQLLLSLQGSSEAPPHRKLVMLKLATEVSMLINFLIRRVSVYFIIIKLSIHISGLTITPEIFGRPCSIINCLSLGEMAELLKAPVLKTGVVYYRGFKSLSLLFVE
jgi:hypothetical protein